MCSTVRHSRPVCLESPRCAVQTLMARSTGRTRAGRAVHKVTPMLAEATAEASARSIHRPHRPPLTAPRRPRTTSTVPSHPHSPLLRRRHHLQRLMPPTRVRLCSVSWLLSHKQMLTWRRTPVGGRPFSCSAASSPRKDPCRLRCSILAGRQTQISGEAACQRIICLPNVSTCCSIKRPRCKAVLRHCHPARAHSHQSRHRFNR